MANVFKAIADPTRRQVLEMLKDGPKSAGQLADAFPVSRPTMSTHFNVLREAGLIGSEKDGKSVIYHLRVSVLEDAMLKFAQAVGVDFSSAPSAKGGEDVVAS